MRPPPSRRSCLPMRSHLARKIRYRQRGCRTMNSNTSSARREGRDEWRRGWEGRDKERREAYHAIIMKKRSVKDVQTCLLGDGERIYWGRMSSFSLSQPLTCSQPHRVRASRRLEPHRISLFPLSSASSVHSASEIPHSSAFLSL